MGTQEMIIGTKTVLVNKETGKILVLTRSKDGTRPLGYDFPGGGIEPDEVPEKAALREIQEETGIVVEKAQLYDALPGGKYR